MLERVFQSYKYYRVHVCIGTNKIPIKNGVTKMYKKTTESMNEVYGCMNKHAKKCSGVFREYQDKMEKVRMVYPEF